MSTAPASRRRLMGSGAALLLLPPFAAGAAKAAELDGELLGLCAEIPKLLAKIREADRAHSWVSDEECNAVGDRWTELVDRIIDTPARTPEGVRAKAMVLRCSLDRYLHDGPGVALTDHAEEEDLLGWSLVHDILGKEADWS